MINFNELSSKLQNIFNGLDADTLSIANPLSNYQFVTNTFGSHLDSVADKKTKKNIIPMFIQSEDGTVGSIKALKEVESPFTIYVYFPIKFKDDFFKLPEFILDVFAGQLYNYGALSGHAISKIDVPQFSQLERQQMRQFRDDISTIYNLPIDETQLYGVCQFTLTLKQYADLKLANGFIVGNQITDTLSFQYDGTAYTETLVYLQDEAISKSNGTNQQALTESETSSLMINTSKTTQIDAYIKDNAFWNKFIELFENGLLQNQEFIFIRSYGLSTTKAFTHNLILDTADSNIVIGEIMYFSMVFLKKAGVITYGTEL